MVVVDLVLAGLKPFLTRHRVLVSCLYGLLEQHIEEQVHRFCLNHECPRGLRFACVEVLVDAVVVDDRDVTCAPVVSNVVVDLVTLAVENVERGRVDVPVLLGLAAGALIF